MPDILIFLTKVLALALVALAWPLLLIGYALISFGTNLWKGR